MRLGIFSRSIAPDITSSRLRRAPHVLATAQGDEVVLFDTARERYYTLNAIGARVWALLRDATTIGEIIATIRREYDAPADPEDDPVERDIGRLAAALRAAGMLMVEPMEGVP